jgi:hypothetical protein
MVELGNQALAVVAVVVQEPLLQASLMVVQVLHHLLLERQ